MPFTGTMHLNVIPNSTTITYLIFDFFFFLLAGLWAVINTAGVCFKGKLEQQDSSQWETMFRVNVFGMLRAARTFMPLLKNKKGTVICILPLSIVF